MSKSVNTFNYEPNDPNAGKKPTMENAARTAYSMGEEEDALSYRYRQAKREFDKAVLNAGKKGVNMKTNMKVREKALYLKHAIENLKSKLPNQVTPEMKTNLNSIMKNINVNINPMGGKSRRHRKSRKASRRRLTRRRR